MRDLLSVRVIGLGLLSWALPFVFSMAFFGANGELQISQPLFKSIMVVTFGAVGALLLVFAFRKVAPTLRNGITIGLLWLAINYALDLSVLLPLSGMGAGQWFAEIGLRYLLIPVMAAAMGFMGGKR